MEKTLFQSVIMLETGCPSAMLTTDSIVLLLLSFIGLHHWEHSHTQYRLSMLYRLYTWYTTCILKKMIYNLSFDWTQSSYVEMFCYHICSVFLCLYDWILWFRNNDPLHQQFRYTRMHNILMVDACPQMGGKHLWVFVISFKIKILRYFICCFELFSKFRSAEMSYLPLGKLSTSFIIMLCNE